MNISVTILTKNNQKQIKRCLESLTLFPEVLIYDNGSTDQTLDIAASFPNVTITKGPFIGFGPTHNLASNLAKNDWILSLDSDEVMTPKLVEEISKLQLNERVVYSFPRHNYYRGKFIRGCGWYPDRQFRIYNKKHTQFSDAQVHEQIIIQDLEHIPLKNSIVHYSYESISDFLTKMESYSTLFSKQNIGKIKSSPLKAISHGFFAFFKSYFLKKGFRDGYEGFLISKYNGHTSYYKYMKLYEANKEKNADISQHS